jgi:hypothetical protein
LLTIILLGEAATSSNPNAFLGIAGLIAVLEFAPMLIMFWINRNKINLDNQPAAVQPAEIEPADVLFAAAQPVAVQPVAVQPAAVLTMDVQPADVVQE